MPDRKNMKMLVTERPIAANRPTLEEAVAGAMYPPGTNVGASPDILQDLLNEYGGLDNLTVAIQAARAGESTADPRLVALTPEQRAQIDRYTNFAKMSKEPGGGVKRAAQLTGGLGAMFVTDVLKKIPGANTVASSVWNKIHGTEDGAEFFGGKDVSNPNLIANLAASYYGWRDANDPRLKELMEK